MDLRMLFELAAAEPEHDVGVIKQRRGTAEAEGRGLSFQLIKYAPALCQTLAAMALREVAEQMRIELKQCSAPVNLIQRNVLLRTQAIRHGKL